MAFFYRQTKGSHEIWRRPNGRYATIPRHSSKSIKRKTLKGIFEDLQITPKEFIKLRQGKNREYFYTKEWQKGETQADKDITEGNVTEPFDNIDDALNGLKHS